ncbi:E7.6.2.1 [Acanthosepion pharaonis]|uniref:E7.6.2.1 n=1 Tax=Acanthosepion pharaonis TaxID=158019 RepID=A0A812DH75_ACAPH|nr:E7.6.2.1 [Sepia pharaonis]
MLTLKAATQCARALEQAHFRAESYASQIGSAAATTTRTKNVFADSAEEATSTTITKNMLSDLTDSRTECDSVQLSAALARGKCYNCGGKRHFKDNRRYCPARDKICRNCGKLGHFSKVCHSTMPAPSRSTSAIIVARAKDDDRKEKRYVKTMWKNLYVGDIVHLSCDEVIPADLLLLASSDSSGLCHIETSNLDGENNLKQRQCAVVSKNQEKFNPTKFTETVICDQPNVEIYKFNGFIQLPNDEKVALNNGNILLRGCVLQNTDFVEGLVIYAGHETKAMLNNRGPRYKRSKLERKINHDIIWCMFLLIFLCIFCASGKHSTL